MNRPTEQYLREAADWVRIDMKSPSHEDSWTPLPHVFGELTK